MKILFSFFAFMPLIVFAQSTGDYRSFASGPWIIAATWERFNGTAWVAAAVFPTNTDGVITIRNGHSVHTDAVITIDQVVVDAGGALSIEPASLSPNVTLSNGPGIDLLVNGTFHIFAAVLQGDGQMVIQGVMNWNFAGSLSISVDITNNAGGIINAFSGEKIFGGGKTLNNLGTINWSDGDIVFAGGASLFNSGTINASGNNAFNDGGGSNLFFNGSTGVFSKSSSGATTIRINTANSGVFKGIGELNFIDFPSNEGTIAPGLSPGILTVNGVFNPLTAFSTLNIEIKDGTGPGTGHDQLLRNATPLTLDGTLNVTETGIVPDGAYTIISSSVGTITGSFDVINLPPYYSLSITATTVVVTKGPAAGDYRSIASGNWFTTTAWERYNGSSWVAAPAAPSNSDGVITIRNGHTISHVAGGVSLDQVVIDAGGVFTMESGAFLAQGTVENGPGIDLIVNGTFNLSSARLFGSGTIEIGGIMNLSFSLLSVDVTNNSGGIINAFGSGENELSGGKTLTNQGTINWSNGDIRFVGGIELVNQGTINASSNNSFIDGGGSNLFTSAPSGEFIKSSSGTTTIGISMENDGTIKGIGVLNFNLINNAGTIAPGLSPGIFTLNSSTNPLTTSSILDIEINDGSGPGTGHDQFLRTGNLTLDGVLNVTETGTVPNGAYTIISLTSGTISGSFDAVNIPPDYSLSTTATTVVVTKAAALPVKLINFYAKKVNAGVQLSWQTATENNSDYFDIEKTKTGNHFVKIGEVSAAGNSSQLLNYNFTDIRPEEGYNLYRLKQVDRDGRFEYSPVVAINLRSLRDVIVTPNPTKDFFTLLSPQMIKKIEIIDLGGRIVTVKQPSATGRYNIEQLKPGMYFILVHSDNGSRTLKLIKQ